jgi:hypothetical protein
MQTAKEEIINSMTSLPETATYEEAMYRLYVLEKINRGREDFKNGRTITIEQLRQEMKSW